MPDNRFHATMELFKKREVIAATKGYLEQLIKIAGFGVNGVVEYNPRIFLTSFMVTIYPTTVFDRNTPETDSLKNAAENITTQFTAIIEYVIKSRLITAVEAEAIQSQEEKDIGYQNFNELLLLTHGFHVNLLAYHTKFYEWKQWDEPRVISNLHNVMVNLITAMYHVSGEHAEMNDTNADIARLMAVLAISRQRLAMFRVNDLIKKFDVSISTYVNYRHCLRSLREEQRRYGDVGFDFLE